MSRPIRNAADLDRRAAAGLATLYPERLKILVGSASCGVAMGARAVEAAAIAGRQGAWAGRRRLPHRLHRLLRAGAAAGPGAARRAAGQLRPNDRREDPRAAGRPTPRGDLQAGVGPGPLRQRRARLDRRGPPVSGRRRRPRPACPSGRRLDFYRRQKKVILRNCGSIDPDVARRDDRPGHLSRGHCARSREMTPDEVIDEMIQSGLRGRGGAAFPTGQKWRLARQAAGRREVRGLQRRRRRAGRLHGPHGPGRRSARDPRRHAHRLLRHRRQRGLHLRPQRVSAGHRDPASTPSTRPSSAGCWATTSSAAAGRSASQVRRGAGAYICGEETALIESLEGHCRRAAHAAALSGHRRPVGQAHRGQQREDLGQRGPDPHPRRRLVRRHGHQAHAGHHDLLAGRRGEERRPGRSALRHLAPRAGLRDRRRRGRRSAAEGRPGRRSVARLHPAVDARPGHRHRRPRRARRSSSAPAGSSCWTTRPAWSTWPASWSTSSSKSRAASAFPAARGPSRCTAS